MPCRALESRLTWASFQRCSRTSILLSCAVRSSFEFCAKADTASRSEQTTKLRIPSHSTRTNFGKLVHDNSKRGRHSASQKWERNVTRVISNERRARVRVARVHEWTIRSLSSGRFFRTEDSHDLGDQLFISALGEDRAFQDVDLRHIGAVCND